MSVIDYKCTNHKILSKHEEYDLFAEYAKTKSIEIRDKIIIHNMKFALKCANAYIARHPHVPLVDLKGYAVEGLIMAIDKYEIERNKKFITCAVWWIKMNITRSVEKFEGLVRYPANIHRDLFKNFNNHTPILDDTMEIDYATVYSNIHGGISMETPIEGDTDICIADTLADEQSSEPPDDTIQLMTLMHKAIAKLPAEERYIIDETYGISSGTKRTTSEIAEELQMSPESVRYIKNKGLNILKGIMRGSTYAK